MDVKQQCQTRVHSVDHVPLDSSLRLRTRRPGSKNAQKHHTSDRIHHRSPRSRTYESTASFVTLECEMTPRHSSGVECISIPLSDDVQSVPAQREGTLLVCSQPLDIPRAV